MAAETDALRAALAPHDELEAASNEPALEPLESIADFLPLKTWLEKKRGGARFRTKNQVDWFVADHRAELIASGEYLPGKGASPPLIGPRFGQLCLKILQREARADLKERA